MDQAFDTLKAARELEASGLDRKQAEAVASVIRSGQGDLVTKGVMQSDLSKLENRLTLRMLGIAALIVAAVKLIPSLY